mmetsp:Transcript_17094/g.22187  ORF Transcript_17094/g.22187 Transcript_17094/m.22187 type:complete len:446 (-) Transcript_17094:66-1403(-)
MNTFPDVANNLFAQYNAAAATMAMGIGNTLQFSLPGFPQPLRVKFPDYRLPVCEKCKKNYKTREMCRNRNGHTDLPWSPVYICVTLDPSCIDENTNKYVKNTPFAIRPSQWQPYCIKKEKVAGYFDTKTPICAACKKKNYTRSFCRERHKHRSLPWSTVYVTLTAMTDLATSSEDNKDDAIDDTPAYVDPNEAALPGSGSDDINEIDPSRTFLIKISAKECQVQWVELDESEMHAFGVGGIAHNQGYPGALRGAANLASSYAAAAAGFYGASATPSTPTSGGMNGSNAAAQAYANFSNAYMAAAAAAGYPSPMQMAQVNGDGSAAAEGSGGDAVAVNVSSDGTAAASTDVNAQYQQYMNWQAQMWYHQQAMMAASATAAAAAATEGEAVTGEEADEQGEANPVKQEEEEEEVETAEETSNVGAVGEELAVGEEVEGSNLVEETTI